MSPPPPKALPCGDVMVTQMHRLRPTHAEVDLGAIAHNTRVLRQHRPSARLCAVLKAEAYGHGAVPVAHTTLRAGAHSIAVALVEEGIALREAGIGAPIYLLCGHYAGAYDAVVAHKLTPIIGQEQDVRQMHQAAARANVRLDVHLELDTGMSRLGFFTQHSEAVARQAAGYSHLRVTGVMTHLSHSDEPEAPSTPRQIAAFDEALNHVRQHLHEIDTLHVLNSGGLVSSSPTHPWDMVRCGLALYGVQPVTDHLLGPLKPALRWLTRVVSLRHLDVGTPVSYGSHWRATRPSIIATLPLGYADGYPRSMSHRAQVLVAGTKVPVVGTICMDLCMIDVTDVPEVRVHDEVVVLGTQGAHTIGANTLAQWSGTIGYEILSRIGPRVPRVYREVEP